MYFSKKCGLSFLAFSRITCLLEMLFSGVIGALCIMAWIKEGKTSQFFYDWNPKNSPDLRNKSLQDCVVIWCISITMIICIWRAVSAVILFFSIQRVSVGMAQYWIMFKLLALIISCFVAITSLTAPVVKIAAITAVVSDLITSYFIAVLFPELDRMSKAIKSNSKGRGSISE